MSLFDFLTIPIFDTGSLHTMFDLPGERSPKHRDTSQDDDPGVTEDRVTRAYRPGEERRGERGAECTSEALGELSETVSRTESAGIRSTVPDQDHTHSGNKDSQQECLSRSEKGG